MRVPPDAEPPTDRFRILSFDGGGIRGLISAKVAEALEQRIGERTGNEGARLSDYFHLFAGTSTGGLIALGLTSPEKLRASDLASFYTEDGPTIFRRDLRWRLRTLNGLIGPTYPAEPLQAAVEDKLGTEKVSEALRELLITSYDMHTREPFFVKRWRAREPGGRNPAFVDAALATSAAPTYFPSHGLTETLDGDEETHALVDGGVFANNPAVAAIVEALKRSEEDPPLTRDDLLAVSIGTGEREVKFDQEQVRRWGKRRWIVPRRGESPLLGAVMGGTVDAPNHWAHTLLNLEPGQGPPKTPDEIGRGSRFYRWQVELDDPIGLDDVSAEALGARLPEAATKLIAAREGELDEIAARVTAAGPLP
jgi:predicted acylesterase/phospholipase RssA